jgi:hypothetical protein
MRRANDKPTAVGDASAVVVDTIGPNRPDPQCGKPVLSMEKEVRYHRPPSIDIRLP